MYSDFAKSFFENFKNTDSDYLLISKDTNSTGNDGPEYFARVPSNNGKFTTIEEAIQWHFEQGYDMIEIYDLYAEWPDSLIRTIKKGSYQPQVTSNITSTTPEIVKVVANIIDFVDKLS
jgi:hypothetical protein